MKILPLIVAIGMLALVSGCDDNARVAQVATEAADRQAQQNQEMARLVEAEVNSRRDAVVATRELQSRQLLADQQRDVLEVERRGIAAQRRTDSWMSEIAEGLGILLFGGLVIAFCTLLLHGLRRDGDASQELSELLVMKLTADSPEPFVADRSPCPSTPKSGLRFSSTPPKLASAGANTSSAVTV